MSRISPNELREQINDILSSYAKNIGNTVTDVSKRVANETVRELKTLGTYRDRTGKYRESFRSKEYSKMLETGRIIYSANGRHRLTHLLENGHVNHYGTKRVEVKAYPHWKEAEQRAIERYLDKLKDELAEVDA